MKKYLFLALFTSLTSGIYAQGDKPSYGPAPYRTLEQTVGETFIVLPTVYKGINHMIYDSKDRALSANINGRSLILMRLALQERKAYFKDSVNEDYIGFTDSKKISDLVPLIDIEESKKLLNKTFWLNVTDIYAGRPTGPKNSTKISGLRFEPVTIIDVMLNSAADFPFMFTLKTSKGEIGRIMLSLSGTNTSLDEKYLFNNVLLSTDPKLTYHFTPAVWKMVQGGYTEIGMPMDAFKLVMGTPRDIHSTQTAKGTRQQWVYGNADHPYYYYFEGGKLVAKQN